MRENWSSSSTPSEIQWRIPKAAPRPLPLMTDCVAVGHWGMARQLLAFGLHPVLEVGQH